MASFGDMSPQDWVLHLANKTAIRLIRSFAPDKKRAFDKYSRIIARYKNPVIGRTYYGAALQCNLNDYIMKRIFFFGMWEPHISRTIETALRPGDTFVDVGANIGYDTLLASASVGPSGRVIAIEAASSIFSQVSKNVERNGVMNVRLVNVAVGAEVGELTLFGGDLGNQGRTSPLDRQGLSFLERVRMEPLDQILTPDERARVRLIKIDIEGGELPVLERITETLELYSSDMRLLVEMSDEQPERSRVVFDKLTRANFEAFAVSNDYALASYIEGQADTVLTKITSLPTVQTDIYFVRPELA